MSWRLQIRHASGYRYQSPVTASYNEARITPLTTTSQTTVESRLELHPPARPYRYWDYWGTLVHAFDIHVPHAELVVTGTSVVETSEPARLDEALDWRQLHGCADEFAEYLAPTAYVPFTSELCAGGDQARAEDGPIASAHAVAEWVRASMVYRPGSTVVSTSAVEALATGEGVCQDFVHVFLGAVRALGIPARYVSGYLHPESDPAVGEMRKGQSHAWAEIWAGGWVAVDPTNGGDPGLRHVVVARGRDYRDVSPLKGIYSGGAAHALEVEVELTRLR